MTQTADITAEAEALIGRLNALAADAESNGDHGVEEACDKAATTLRTLQEGVALERSRAEAAEAKLAEAMKALEPFAAVAEHDIGVDATDDDIFWPISNARYTISGRLRVGHLRAARKFLKENGNGK